MPTERFKKVPVTFASVQEYIAVFEPLVLEECGALLVRGNEEALNMQAHQAVVAITSLQDEFLVSRIAMDEGVARDYSDNDFILLSKDDPNDESARAELHAIGFVDGHEGQQSLSVKFYMQMSMQEGNDAGKKRVQAMQAGLSQPGSTWYVLKLSSMSTIMREWSALHAVQDLRFKDVLLSAKTSTSRRTSKLMVPQIMKEKVEAEYNASQVSAVTQGLDGTPVVLIQGPPGTGKTRTILALLSIIMHSAPPGSARLLKGSTTARPIVQIGMQDQKRLWLQASPWLIGANPREAIKPWDAPSTVPTYLDAFGLLSVSKPVRVGKDVGRKSHVLVCAPSNSALDEIVMRLLSTGLLDEHGDKHTPGIIRMGMNVHHSVASVSMETLVERRLEATKESRGGRGPSRIERDRMKLALLEEAHIVCSTLSFSGSGLFAQMSRKFDVVVIDEAAQAVEPAILVPLVQGVKQVYLVGDPIQLPATVISKRAVSFGYDVSLFKRLQQAGYPVQVLDTQYRMHPSICRFPSNQFYDGGVKTGEGVEAQTQRPWHADKAFGPFVFYDVSGKESIPEGSSSIVNVVEVEMVLCVYRELVHLHPDLRTKPSVAVISPYKAQVKLMREKFRQALGEEGARIVDVNTVDGFQGREKDVAIFSTVRTQVGRSIGFVADERRMNVGLTRARSSLIVIGNAKALKGDERWGNLIKQATVDRCLYRPAKPFADYLQKVISGKVAAAKPTAADLKANKVAAPASAVNAAPDEDDADLYSDDDTSVAATTGLHARAGKRRMEGATPGNQIAAAKRAKQSRP
ncbi:hypothetical protein WJX82_006920 [Trebouxia sp. C0006]